VPAFFSFAGHAHEVLAPRLEGQIQADAAHIDSSAVHLSFETAALQVSGRGEPPQDVPKVRARMIGPELLDVARIPAVTFRSARVAGREAGKDSYELHLTGELELHGVRRSIVVPVRVSLAGGELRAYGTLVLRQTDFALTPVSVAGVVKVKDELSIDFTIVAAQPTASQMSPDQQP
jgi:polyisoprenoid-binding protein YceI